MSFSPRNFNPTVEAEHITDTRDWAAFNTKTVEGLASSLALLRQLHAADQWEAGGLSWLCLLVPLGVVLPLDDGPWLSLGHVQYLSALLVKLEEVPSANPSVKFFTFPAERRDWTFKHIVALDPEDVKVVPTEAVAPVGVYLHNRRRFPARPGVLLKTTGEACSALAHSARTCFA